MHQGGFGHDLLGGLDPALTGAFVELFPGLHVAGQAFGVHALGVFSVGGVGAGRELCVAFHVVLLVVGLDWYCRQIAIADVLKPPLRHCQMSVLGLENLPFGSRVTCAQLLQLSRAAALLKPMSALVSLVMLHLP